MKERWDVPKIEVPEKWNGCLLVNPLCPDDLCWLPAENGRQHRWHCLSTDRWDHRFTIGDTAFFMSKVATSAYDLYVEGWQRQFKLFPDEMEFRRQVWDRQTIAEILDYPGPRTTPIRRHGHNPRNPLLNRSQYHPKKKFPCWCGESLVANYRQMVVCCVDYLGIVGPMVYLDLEEQ